MLINQLLIFNFNKKEVECTTSEVNELSSNDLENLKDKIMLKAVHSNEGKVVKISVEDNLKYERFYPIEMFLCTKYFEKDSTIPILIHSNSINFSSEESKDFIEKCGLDAVMLNQGKTFLFSKHKYNYIPYFSVLDRFKLELDKELVEPLKSEDEDLAAKWADVYGKCMEKEMISKIFQNNGVTSYKENDAIQKLAFKRSFFSFLLCYPSISINAVDLLSQFKFEKLNDSVLKPGASFFITFRPKFHDPSELSVSKEDYKEDYDLVRTNWLEVLSDGKSIGDKDSIAAAHTKALLLWLVVGIVCIGIIGIIIYLLMRKAPRESKIIPNDLTTI